MEAAQGHGWLDVDVTSDRFAALNTLVAAVFSGGTINERFEPAFSPDTDGVVSTRVTDALDKLGAGTKTRGDDDPDRATEILPGTNPSVLGRVLIALGALHGAKNSDVDISLPAYLDESSQSIRRDFVQIYLWNRGQKAGNGDTVQIIENRPQNSTRSWPH